MRRPLRFALVAATVASPLLVLPASGHAASTLGELCAAAKLKATGKAGWLSLECHARAARRGADVDATCLAKASAKLVRTFTRTEARGGCATTGDVGDIAGTIEANAGAIVAALRPEATANTCAGLKLGATGKKVKAKLGCHVKAMRKGHGVETGCLGRVENRFRLAFRIAEEHPPCLTMSDAADVESQVDQLVDAVVAALPSEGPVCGNGVVDGAEQCDTTTDPLCASGGRSGCFPAANANACKCCTLSGETGLVDSSGTYPNECCDGASPLPAGPGAYFCP